MEVIGEASSGLEAVEMARALQPDVIVMDMVMPHMTGIEATVQIKKSNPDARILILTSFSEQDSLAKAIKAGAMGYLLKESQPDDLLHAIRSVYRGQLTIPQNLALKLVSVSQQPDTPGTELSEREQEVLASVAQGLSNKEIAEKLTISTNTVRSHISSILTKLNLSNRTQLALYAMEERSDRE
jgi:NarL family two-component system response regulator LiaR